MSSYKAHCIKLDPASTEALRDLKKSLGISSGSELIRRLLVATQKRMEKAEASGAETASQVAFGSEI